MCFFRVFLYPFFILLAVLFSKGYRLNPALWMLAATAAFSAMGAMIKVLSRLPAWEVVFFRAFINLLWLIPWFLRASVSDQAVIAGWKKEYKTLLIRGVFGCVSMVLYFYAISKLNLADAVMLNYSSPVPTLILSYFVLGERLTKKSVVFVAVAFLGVGFILKPQFEVASMAGIAGIASAFAAAVAYVSIKAATRSIPPNFIVFTFAIVASLMSVVPTLLFFVAPTPLEWGFLVAAGTCATFAQQSMTKAYAGLPASVASPLSLATVVFSGLLGWFFGMRFQITFRLSVAS